MMVTVCDKTKAFAGHIMALTGCAPDAARLEFIAREIEEHFSTRVAEAVAERDQLLKSMEQTNAVLLKRLLDLRQAVEQAHEKAAQGYCPPCYRILDKALAAYKKEK